MKYNYNELSIGDKVYFKVDNKPNFDLYWTITDKLMNNYIRVEIKEMGVDATEVIHVNSIIRKDQF